MQGGFVASPYDKTRSIQVLQNEPRDHPPGCDFVPPLVDHIRYFCFAPAHLRIAANMFDLALGDAAVCLLRPLWSAEGAAQAGCGVRLLVQP